MPQPLKLFEHQCSNCGGYHRRSECKAPPLPHPWNITGHPAVGVYGGPDGIHIGHPKH